MVSRGIVIKKTDAGEDNELITFYTRDFGKLTAIARSVKKPTSRQASHLEVFNLVDFRLVEGRAYPIVASAQSSETFGSLKKSLHQLAAGFFLLESFDRLVYDYEKDPALWSFLHRALWRLNREEWSAEEMKKCLTGIKEEFLAAMGYDQQWEAAAVNYFFESLNQKKFVSLDFLNTEVISKPFS